jgi:hypothetical protein
MHRVRPSQPCGSPVNAVGVQVVSTEVEREVADDEPKR